MDEKVINQEEINPEEVSREENIDEAKEHEEDIEALREKAKMADELTDRLLRLSAEFDNYKKRTAKEKENMFNEGRASCAIEILNLADNLERGYQAVCEAGADDSVKQGMELILKQLDQTFKSLGIEEIPAMGEEFDPQVHDAVMHINEENTKPNTIVEVFQKGYKMDGKVLRHSMVKVAN